MDDALDIEPSTKDRCRKCRVPLRLCFCEDIPELVTSTWLTLLIHSREIRKTSNTGRFAHLALKNSNVIVRGDRDTSLFETKIAKDGFVPLLLFPAPGATVLTQDFLSTLEHPAQLIVPDGNWRQASKAVKRTPELRPIRKVMIPLSSPSEYKLRTEPRRPEGLATLEAITKAFDILHGEAIGKPLERLFKMMVMRNLMMRGKIKTNLSLDPYESSAR